MARSEALGHTAFWQRLTADAQAVYGYMLPLPKTYALTDFQKSVEALGGNYGRAYGAAIWLASEGRIGIEEQNTRARFYKIINASGGG